jgi:hypothetical protein
MQINCINLFFLPLNIFLVHVTNVIQKVYFSIKILTGQKTGQVSFYVPQKSSTFALAFGKMFLKLIICITSSID